MELKFNDAQMGEMIGAAVMQQLTQESRDLLIKNAITHLLTPAGNSVYGSKAISPLQEQFNYQVTNFARKFIEEQLVGDSELLDRLKAVVVEATNKVFLTEDTRTKLVNKMADAIVAGFGDRY